MRDNSSSVSANEGRASAIKKDGSFWAWGFSYVQSDGYDYAGLADFGASGGVHYQARLPVKIADDVKSSDIDVGTHAF
jgi:hypothetical protein